MKYLYIIETKETFDVGKKRVIEMKVGHIYENEAEADVVMDMYIAGGTFIRKLAVSVLREEK